MDVTAMIIILTVLGLALAVANRWSKRQLDRSGPNKPGWYDDPDGVADRQTYWDGQRWSGQTRTRWENTKKPWVAIGLGFGLVAASLGTDAVGTSANPLNVDVEAVLLGLAGLVVLVWTIGLLVIRWPTKRRS
jgi:hypothetical protein